MTPRSQYRSALKAIEILMFKWKIYCTQSSIYNVPLAQHLFSFPRSAIKWLIPCLCFSLLIHLLVEIVPTDDVSLYISLSPLDILTFEPCAMCVHFGKINFFLKIETELKIFLVDLLKLLTFGRRWWFRFVIAIVNRACAPEWVTAVFWLIDSKRRAREKAQRDCITRRAHRSSSSLIWCNAIC